MVSSHYIDQIASADGLLDDDRQTARDLVLTWHRHLSRNWLLLHAQDAARPRNIGPPNLARLEQVIGWPAKAVAALSDRSQFDGYVCDDEEASAYLQWLVAQNQLKGYYRRAVREELKLCCAFL